MPAADGDVKADVEAEAVEKGEVVEKAVTEVKIDAVYVTVDVSGSIRGGETCIYPKWVTKDVQAVAKAEAAGALRWILWGSAAEARDSLAEVVAYLGDESKTLGGTEPTRFIEMLPPAGVIDLHVYTDGEIGEWDVVAARQELDQRHADLKVRRVVINYVNSNLDSMNVGLSAIFDGHVLEMHRTRVADGKKVHEFDARPLDSAVSIVEILDQYIGLDKTEKDMTKGMHYLAQRFANADEKLRREIRRLVRERVDAVNREHRARFMTAEEEAALLAAVGRRDWGPARKPFIGHAVAERVKLMQAYCQKFLNETKQGALIRISAYAPLLLKTQKGGEQFDAQEEVLLDHIMYMGLGKEAVIAMPVSLEMPAEEGQGRGKRNRKQKRRRAEPRLLSSAVKCALAVAVKANFDNTFGLDTLFRLREQQGSDGVADVEPEQYQEEMDALQTLAARALQPPEERGAEPSVLSSSALDFGVNPFTRQHMDCVLLVPASAASLSAARLAELDSWNAHMMSRFVRAGRTMPSVPLVMAIVLERAFADWNIDAMARAEDQREARRLRDVCRQYLARWVAPLTFGVGLPVVIHGTFATAARLACSVLQSSLDPSLPLDVLTQFWSTLPESLLAAQVWSALLPYARMSPCSDGVPLPLPLEDAFPTEHHRTLLALMAGVQYTRSARDARLRAKKGRAYSVRMYTKRLDQLVAAGCNAARLLHEEKAMRRDLFGVPEEEPLLCVHGVDAADCRPSQGAGGQRHDTLCVITSRPTLLNKATMDMWYVGQPQDVAALALESFHKAMWQLARKRTKGGKPRCSDFPPPEAAFQDYVNHRMRAAYLQRAEQAKGDGGRVPAGVPTVLPTVACPRLAQDIADTYHSYVELAHRVRNITRKKFLKSLKALREVCAFGECCEYIRSGVTQEQLVWIDGHATHLQVAGDADVLSGKVSYRHL